MSEITPNKIAEILFPSNGVPIDCTINTSNDIYQDVTWHTNEEWSELIDFSGNSCNMRIREEYKGPLIDNINKLTDRGQSLIYVAARFGLSGHSSKPFEVILNCPNLDINQRNTDGSTAAIGAAWERDDIENGIHKYLFDILEKLKNKGADLTLLNYRGETVKSIISKRLEKARLNGHIEFVSKMEELLFNLF